MSREKLYQLIEQLPEGQVGAAIAYLEGLSGGAGTSRPENAGSDKRLDEFLTVLVSGISNVLYDLSKEAERRNETITANRHNFSMKKIKEAWEEYKS